MNDLDQSLENLEFYLSIRYDAYQERLERAFLGEEIVLGNEASQNNIIKEYQSAQEYIQQNLGEKKDFIEEKIKQFENSIGNSNPQEKLVAFISTLDIIFGEMQPDEVSLILESIKKRKIENNSNSIFWMPGVENAYIVNGNNICEIPIEVLSSFFNEIVDDSVNYSPKFKYETDFNK